MQTREGSSGRLVVYCAPDTRERMAGFARCSLACAVSCAPRRRCYGHMCWLCLYVKVVHNVGIVSSALARADVREVGEACGGRSEGVRRSHCAGA